MSDPEDVDARLEALAEELDLESKAAGRAVAARARFEDEDPESGAVALSADPDQAALETRGGPGVLGLIAIGAGALVVGKLALKTLLWPLFGAIALAGAAFKLAVLGGLVYGGWRLYRWLGEADPGGD